MCTPVVLFFQKVPYFFCCVRTLSSAFSCCSIAAVCSALLRMRTCPRRKIPAGFSPITLIPLGLVGNSLFFLVLIIALFLRENLLATPPISSFCSFFIGHSERSRFRLATTLSLCSSTSITSIKSYISSRPKTVFNGPAKDESRDSKNPIRGEMFGYSSSPAMSEASIP